MTDFANVSWSLKDGVGLIELNRPDSLNAWIPDLGRELLRCVRVASADPEVRAVMITGAGRAFSSGADLKAPREELLPGQPDFSSRLKTIYNPVLLAIRDAPKPIVAAVNGPAAGVGAALALACDLIVAAESAYLLLAFVNIGLVPDGAASYLLASRCGFGRAAQLAMLGDRLAARDALEWGVINAVFPDVSFREDASSYAARLAAGPTIAYANMKRALRAGAHAGLAEALGLDATLQQVASASFDHVEGVAALREKRRPNFTGT
jgi:2-(1,2-epoxy-1,2-dihydrophenyl)acetyl-CoA isomerase